MSPTPTQKQSTTLTRTDRDEQEEEAEPGEEGEGEELSPLEQHIRDAEIIRFLNFSSFLYVFKGEWIYIYF